MAGEVGTSHQARGPFEAEGRRPRFRPDALRKAPSWPLCPKEDAARRRCPRMQTLLSTRFRPKHTGRECSAEGPVQTPQECRAPCFLQDVVTPGPSEDAAPPPACVLPHLHPLREAGLGLCPDTNVAPHEVRGAHSPSRGGRTGVPLGQRPSRVCSSSRWPPGVGFAATSSYRSPRPRPCPVPTGADAGSPSPGHQQHRAWRCGGKGLEDPHAEGGLGGDPYSVWTVQKRILYTTRKRKHFRRKTASPLISICKKVFFHLRRKRVLLGQPRLSLG